MLHDEYIGKELLNIYDAVGAALASGDIDKITDAVLALDSAKREIGEMFESAKNSLLEVMGDSPECQHHGFTFEKKNGAPRKTWDHHSLGELVAKRLINLSTDMETGELTRSPIEIAVDMLTYAAPSYWRVTELNKIGVNADNYCDVGEPKASIIIRKAS
jgi:hypothetical protein